MTVVVARPDPLLAEVMAVSRQTGSVAASNRGASILPVDVVGALSDSDSVVDTLSACGSAMYTLGHAVGTIVEDVLGQDGPVATSNTVASKMTVGSFGTLSDPETVVDTPIAMLVSG